MDIIPTYAEKPSRGCSITYIYIWVAMFSHFCHGSDLDTVNYARWLEMLDGIGAPGDKTSLGLESVELEVCAEVLWIGINQ